MDYASHWEWTPARAERHSLGGLFERHRGTTNPDGQPPRIHDTFALLMLVRTNLVEHLGLRVAAGALRPKSPIHLASFLAAFVLLPACKRDSPTPPAAQAPPSGAPAAARAPAPSSSALSAHKVSPPWFDGTPEQAFAKAKKDGALVFLYWGAVWCPPCNELKAQVFNKPQFADIVRGFVPVYLDGDTADAQRLGETFAISGYPTILILTPEKEELLRLGGSLAADEVERALAAVRAQGQSFRAALDRVESKKATEADCNLLAHAAWELLPEEQWPPTKVMTSLRSAVDACPAKLERERSLLTATLVGMAAMGRKDPEAATIVKEVETKVSAYFDIMFKTQDTAWAARAFINNRAGDMADWLEGKKPTPVTTGWKAKWLEAAQWIRERKEASVDTRLSSHLPLVEFELHANPDKPVSEGTQKLIVEAAAKANKDARNPYDRHAVISGAAYLLRQVGRPEKAKSMLIAEAYASDTPFYYYSSLAAQEKALGHMDEARKWSRKAREKAAGRATRLQWIANDVQINANPSDSVERKYLLGLAEEFYSLAMSLDDGFLGRNRVRAKQIRKTLEDLQGDDVKELLARYKAACEQLAAEPRAACQKCFE